MTTQLDMNINTPATEKLPRASLNRIEELIKIANGNDARAAAAKRSYLIWATGRRKLCVVVEWELRRDKTARQKFGWGSAGGRGSKLWSYQDAQVKRWEMSLGAAEDYLKDAQQAAVGAFVDFVL